MALVYRGNIKILEEQVHQHRDQINRRYQEVLGDEYYERLSQIADKILVPECFFNTIDELNKVSTEKIPEENPSKFLVFSDAEISLDEEGRIKQRKAKISFGFCINEYTFRYSGSSKFTDQILASYIHEYDHFVWGALQRVPLYLARQFACTQLGHGMVRLEDLEKVIRKIETDDTSSDQEKKNLLFLAGNAYTMHAMWEDSTRILDKLILESVGIEVPLPFRGKEREYRMRVVNDPYVVLQVPVGGDCFKNLEDKDVIHRVIRWEEYLNPMWKTSFVDNFFDSLKKFEVQLLPYHELKKVSGEEWKKYKQSKHFQKISELKKKHKRRKRK